MCATKRSAGATRWSRTRFAICFCLYDFCYAISSFENLKFGIFHLKRGFKLWMFEFSLSN
jgi:hypothetical protein